METRHRYDCDSARFSGYDIGNIVDFVVAAGGDVCGFVVGAVVALEMLIEQPLTNWPCGVPNSVFSMSSDD